MRIIVGIFFAAAIFLASCTTPTYTIMVQNTHQYWDTLDYCLVISDNKELSFTDTTWNLKPNDSVLWKFQVIRSDTNTMYRKIIDLSKFKSREPYFLKYALDVKGERLKIGYEQSGNHTKYTVLTIKNSGGAYYLKEFGTNSTETFENKTFIDFK